MAIKQITYSDIFFNFEKVPISDDLGLITNERSVEQSILSLLQTNFGDRLYHREIGSNVNDQLFKNINFLTAHVTKRFITTTINNFEPRVTLTNIDIGPNEDFTGFIVSIEYKLKNNESPNQKILLQITDI